MSCFSIVCFEFRWPCNINCSCNNILTNWRVYSEKNGRFPLMAKLASGTQSNLAFLLLHWRNAWLNNYLKMVSCDVKRRSPMVEPMPNCKLFIWNGLSCWFICIRAANNERLFSNHESQLSFIQKENSNLVASEKPSLEFNG